MRQDTKDAIGRRTKFGPPQSSGKHVYPGKAGLSTFQALDNHGPLTVRQLFDLMRAQNYKAYVKKLCDLFHEDNALFGGQYIYKPDGQRQTNDPRLQAIVYANNLSAWRYMAGAGVIEPRDANHWHQIHNSFWHQHMVATITHGIELACWRNGLTFVHQHEILNGKALSINVPITFEKEYYDGPLQPDGLFAIDYPNGQRRYVFLEADRNTEGVNVKKLSVKSYRRKLLQYRELISEGIYKDFLDTDFGALVLHVTTDRFHMETMIKCMLDISDGKGNTYNLFKCDTDFGLVPVVSLSKPEYGTEPWRRAGREPLSIL